MHRDLGGWMWASVGAARWVGAFWIHARINPSNERLALKKPLKWGSDSCPKPALLRLGP